MALIEAVALAALMLVVVYVVHAARTEIRGEASRSMSPDEIAVRQLVHDFAVANRNVDDERVMELLCPDEAQDYLDFIGEPSDDCPVPVDHVDVTVTNVVIIEPYASAAIEDERGTRSLHFLRVEDHWTVCQSAESEMQGAPSPGD